MSQIKINKKIIQETIEVSEGELVMLVVNNNFSKNGNLKSATLGVVGGIKKYSHQAGKWGGNSLKIKNLYRLFPTNSFGNLIIPILSYKEEQCYNCQTIKEMYLEKEQIIKKLKENHFLKGHIEWIEKLEKPY